MRQDILKDILEEISENYDFGPDIIFGSWSGWEEDSKTDFRRVCFLEFVDSEDSVKATLNVQLYPNLEVKEVVAYLSNGHPIGFMPNPKKEFAQKLEKELTESKILPKIKI